MDNELIFSTKDIPPKPVWGVWVTMFIMPILIFIAFPVAVASILSGIVIGICIIGAIKVNTAKKSYIDIYSEKVVGCDTSTNVPVTFELKYDEIIKMDSQPGTVRLHWSGGLYIVKAPDCEQKVIAIISEHLANK